MAMVFERISAEREPVRQFPNNPAGIVVPGPHLKSHRPKSALLIDSCAE